MTSIFDQQGEGWLPGSDKANQALNEAARLMGFNSAAAAEGAGVRLPKTSQEVNDFYNQRSNRSTPINSSQLNTLVNEAAAGGQAGGNARAALQQRAAAGDPQAANALQALNSRPQTQARPQSAPAATQTTNRPQQQPRKEPTAEEMAEEIDKRNRAQEIAAAKAKVRKGPTPEERRQMQDANARALMQSAMATAKANPNNPKTQADAAKAYQQAQQTLMRNQAERNKEGGGSRGGRGGGGGGRGGGAPRQTAKERNMAADAAASKAARRADSRGIADSAYRNANQDSAAWGENEAARRARLEKAGLNPDYKGWRDNPQYEKDVEAATKRQWDNFNARQKEKEKQAQRKTAADNYRKAMQDGSFTDADGNIKPSKNPDGSASEDLLLWTQMQRPPGSGRKMVHAYGNKHSSVMVAARGQNP